MNSLVRISNRIKMHGLKYTIARGISKVLGNGKSSAKIINDRENALISEGVKFIEVGAGNNPVIKSLVFKKYPAIHIPTKNVPSLSHSTAIFAHIFYPEMCEFIKPYLNNFPWKVDIFVSTDTEYKKQEILRYFSNLTCGKLEVRVFQNRGRDIAPLFCGFKDKILKYEYILHIHTKKSPHAKELDGWGQYCLDHLLGSREIIDSIFSLLEDDCVGIVAPTHYKEVVRCINWGYDFDKTKEILSKLGRNIDCNTLLDFPSGSMFWAKSSIFKDFLSLDITVDDFEEENGQIDGTLAHSIERSLYYICEESGKCWLRVTKSPQDEINSVKIDSTLNDAILEKVFSPLSNRYVLESDMLNFSVPEAIRINCFPIYHNQRPRINLLVPSLNSAHIFGGIATALKIYRQFKQELKGKVDYRIIVTDGKLDSEARLKYEKEFVENADILSDEKQEIVVEAFDRLNLRLYVRPNDYFIATAWWTAKLSQEIVSSQKTFFGISNKFVYLIQDYEPNFYAWSSRWGLANTTYDSDCIAVINSEELANLLYEKFKFENAFVVRYKINDTLKSLAVKGNSKQKQILIYGRPSVDRNCFELLMDGIALWQRRNPHLAKAWKICSAGEQYDPHKVAEVKNLNVYGKLTLENYAKLLNESAVGISLMMSPHPSYPPLEMAYFGCQTITNIYEGKDLSLRSKNILNIRNFSVEELAQKIHSAVNSEAVEFAVMRDIQSDIPDFNVQVVFDLLFASH